MPISIGFWDILLVAVVSIQATVLAYLYDPRLKAFVLTLPFPFTVASLAVGRPLDATNILGLILLLMFAHMVRLLHVNLHVNIIVSIALSALIYCVIGTAMARLVPNTPAVFWGAVVLTVVVALVLVTVLPHRHERGHRSPLPIWIKLPIIIGVVLFLVLIKNGLRGFMTVFPMVTVIACYEARNSLWAIGRQIPILMLTMTPMMLAIRIAQSQLHLRIGLSLVAGWVVFLTGLAITIRFRRPSYQRPDATGSPGAG